MATKRYTPNLLRAVALGSGLAFATIAATGCASDVTAPADVVPVVTPVHASIQRYSREIHFDLGKSVPNARYELELGGATYPVNAHDASSLSRYHAKATRLLASGRAPTHYVTGARFSKEAPQSYSVVRISADGTRTLALAGVHIPDDKDPFTADANDAAAYLAFRDPTMLTIDTGAASKVLAHIKAAPSFGRLVQAIKDYGDPTTLEDQDAHKSGWAVTVLTTTADGAPILAPTEKNQPTRQASHWVTAGSPEYYAKGFHDHYYRNDQGQRVRYTTPYEALRTVLAEARQAMRDDAALADKMWTLQADTTVRVQAKPNLTAAAADPKFTYTVDDPQWKGDRRVEIVSTEGRKVTFAVHNNGWRRQGVLVRFRKVDGTLIPKSALDKEEIPESEAASWANDLYPYSTILNIVDGRFTVLGVPLSSETVEKFTIELPREASSFEVNIASAGFQRSAPPSYVSQIDGKELEPLMILPGQVDTLLLDVALPLIGLTMGAGAEHLTKASPIVKALSGVGLEVAGSLLVHAYASGATGVNAFTRDYAVELIAEVIAKAPAVAAALVEWAAEVSAEKALESTLAFVGLAIEAIEVAGTLAQLGETIGTIATNAPITYDRIQAGERLQIVATPSGGSGFSGLAKQARAYVYYGSSTVPTVTPPVRIDPSMKDVSFTLEAQPAGGEVRVKVALESDNGWVAGEGEIETANEPGPDAVKTVAVALEQNPTPIDAATKYQHDRILALDGNGKRVWKSGVAAPTTTAPQICNTADTSHPWLCGAGSMTINDKGVLGYSWTGSGTQLATCGGSSNVAASMAQTINVGPGEAESRLARSSCGSEAPIFLAFDPTGTLQGKHVMVQQVMEKTDGKTSAPVYEVFPVDLASNGPLDAVISGGKSLGHFRSSHLDEIVQNPATGMVLGLDKSAGVVEVLKLASSPMPFAEAPEAVPVGGAGNLVGRIHGAQSLAFLPAGAGFMVLESDRIQAFTFDGATVARFAGQAAFPLKSEGGAKVTYTDMKIDPTESYVYVASYVGEQPTPNDYRLDIYRMSDGSFVSRTEGVVGAKIAIDRWRDLYTLNYANLAGATWPEPSVSEWIAPPMEGPKGE
ncbi:MAG: hypothetical protein JST00_22615 [Deltaproteobacteria bacterium]|nr:hypothetical protein [Deltaproteobacteria bacterium]